MSKKNYLMFAQISFKAETDKEATEKTWQLEQLLEEKGYYLRQHHTGQMNNIRSVRYGR